MKITAVLQSTDIIEIEKDLLKPNQYRITFANLQILCGKFQLDILQDVLTEFLRGE